MVTMYKQYADKLVEETWEWRRLVNGWAQYAEMRERLVQMDKGEGSDSDNGMYDMEDLDPTML